MRRDPWSVPREFAPKRFADCVHDFVAECLDADPDWDFLRWRMGQFDQFRPAPPPGRIPSAIEATQRNDWEYVLWTADSHQGDGPVRSRMLDERLADLLPNEDYKGRLVHHRDVVLAGAREQWLSDCADALTAMNDAGVSWVTPAGPGQYSVFPGMLDEIWPRGWGDLEIFVSEEWRPAAIAAVESVGFAETPIPHGGGTYWTRGDFYIDIQGGHYGREEHPDRFAVDVAGVQVWMAPRPVLVCQFAQRAICAYAHGGPLTLWYAARQAHWAEGVSEDELRHAISTGLDCRDCWQGGLTRQEEILWGMGMAQRLYGLAVPNGLAPAHPTRRFPTWGHQEKRFVVTVPPWPSDEVMLFGDHYCRGIEERIQRGHWIHHDDPPAHVGAPWDDGRGLYQRPPRPDQRAGHGGP